MGEITYAWAPITKAERQEDGSVIVTGPMSDAGLDRDGQGMNQAWLDEVAPKWFEESGNIREQHDRFKAAGVGIGLHRQADGTFVLQSRIVDPTAALKCLPGPNGERPVYQGYSIGIREPRISFEKAQFPGGEVVGGYICETSLADRPSNPRMLFTMVKSDGPDDLPYPVGEEHEEPEAGPDAETPTGEDVTKVDTKPGQRFRHGWIPIDAAGEDLEAYKTHLAGASDETVRNHEHAHRLLVGAGRGNSGALGVATDELAKRKLEPHGLAKPPKAKDQGMGEIKGVGHTEPGTVAGPLADKLSPEARDRARTLAEHQETERQAASAMGAGMFDAAIRQAEAAAARRRAAAPPMSPERLRAADEAAAGRRVHADAAAEAGRVRADAEAAARRVAADQKLAGKRKRADKWAAARYAAGRGVDWMAAELSGGHDHPPSNPPVLRYKAEVPDLLKFVPAKKRAKYAESGVAMPNGDFPIPDRGHLSSALGLLSGYTGDQAAAKAHIQRRAAALGVDVDLDGDGATEKLSAIADLAKATGYLIADLIKGDAPDDDTDEVEAMDKNELMGMITTAVTDAVKGSEERTGEKIAALAGRLEKVEAAPAPGGPAQTRAPVANQQAKNREVVAVQEQIADLDRQALMLKSEDPQLSQGYREMADDLRARLIRS